MKALLFSGLIGAAISGAVVQPSAVTDVFGNADSIVDLYNRIFPGDPLKQEALDLCFRQDHAFNRLFGSERSACYAKFLPSQLAGARSGTSQDVRLHAANFVDLWQSAGRGHAPKDDVRAQQQATQVAHPATARLTP